MDASRKEKKSQSSFSSSATSPCGHLRAAYHNCFNRWYAEKFVKGHWDKDDCVSEWQKYRACLSEHLDDKHLSRFLEAEITPGEFGNPVAGASAAEGVSASH